MSIKKLPGCWGLRFGLSAWSNDLLWYSTLFTNHGITLYCGTSLDLLHMSI